jgi:tripartite-type tricarboxylate transporter receptor subunit TctC
MQAIPYKSANEMVLAVISGQVTTAFADAGPVLPQVKAGTVRALAVAAPRRSDDFPDVPALKELGVDVDGTLWTAVFAPKKTPPEIARKLEGEFMRISKMPDVIARLKALGIDVVGNSTEEFTRVLSADIARWGDVARSANIKIEP